MLHDYWLTYFYVNHVALYACYEQLFPFTSSHKQWHSVIYWDMWCLHKYNRYNYPHLNIKRRVGGGDEKKSHKMRPVCFCPHLSVLCWSVQTLPNLQDRYSLEDAVQFEFCTIQNWVQVLSTMYAQGNPTEIQTQTHCNLISCSMTSLPSVLLPCSTPPPPHHTASSFPQRKMWRTFQYVVINFFSYFFKTV